MPQHRRAAGLLDNWMTGLFGKLTNPFIQQSNNPIHHALSVRAGFATLCARCQSNPIQMPR
jgi:hypothetical protein